MIQVPVPLQRQRVLTWYFNNGVLRELRQRKVIHLTDSNGVNGTVEHR